MSAMSPLKTAIEAGNNIRLKSGIKVAKYVVTIPTVTFVCL